MSGPKPELKPSPKVYHSLGLQPRVPLEVDRQESVGAEKEHHAIGRDLMDKLVMAENMGKGRRRRGKKTAVRRRRGGRKTQRRLR